MRRSSIVDENVKMPGLVTHAPPTPDLGTELINTVGFHGQKA